MNLKDLTDDELLDFTEVLSNFKELSTFDQNIVREMFYRNESLSKIAYTIKKELVSNSNRGRGN